MFPLRKVGIFRPGKEIEGLRGGVLLYAAQVIPKIDTARAEKDPFRTETSDRRVRRQGQLQDLLQAQGPLHVWTIVLSKPSDPALCHIEEDGRG